MIAGQRVIGLVRLAQKPLNSVPSATLMPFFAQNPCQMSIHSSSRLSMGFEEFFDQKKKSGDEVHVGRAWTASDLRRKSFDDLHKLWFVLYKERNLLLSERERIRRNQRPITPKEETRYIKVKRSMAAIKLVLRERSKIRKLIEAEGGHIDQPLADTKFPEAKSTS